MPVDIKLEFLIFLSMAPTTARRSNYPKKPVVVKTGTAFEHSDVINHHDQVYSFINGQPKPFMEIESLKREKTP